MISNRNLFVNWILWFEKTIFISVKRVTFSYTGWYNICLISIHTPAKGVTLHLLEVLLLLTISIHTPTKGVTEGFVVDGYLDGISIHTPTKGVTKSYTREDVIIKISIHTPTKGVTAKITYFIPNTDFCIDNVTKFQHHPLFTNTAKAVFCNIFPVRTSPAFHVSLPFAPNQIIKIPSGSYDDFTPKCSTLA